MRARPMLCGIVAALTLTACGEIQSAPLFPDGARYDNGGSLGGGGRTGGTGLTATADSVSPVTPLNNGGSLGGGGR
jgi:hypothetical protein